MNNDIFEGKWKEIKGELRSTWGELTDDELEKAKGNTESIVGLLEQKYGKAKENFSEKLNLILSKFNLHGLKTSLEDKPSEERHVEEDEKEFKKIV